MTAEDVAFTYRTIGHPDYNGPRSYAVSNLVGYTEYSSGASADFEGIKVIDDKTVSFTFKEGLASPANIECFIYGIMSKDYYAFDKWEDFLALNEKPLGSGLFVFDSWAPKEFIKMNKNDKYWDSKNGAKIEGLLLSNVPDESILSALQTGQIDFAQVFTSVENKEALAKLENIDTTIYLANGYTFMCFNTMLPKLADVRVRQALMYSLDRESFIKVQYGEGLAEVGTAPIAPVSWAYPDKKDLNTYP